MSNDNTPAPPVGARRAGRRRSVPSFSPRQTALAEQRRKAFRQFLFNQRMSAAELARRAGLPTANTIYNFMSGRNASLSQTTLEMILAAMPGVTITDLMGSPRYSPPTRIDRNIGSPPAQGGEPQSIKPFSEPGPSVIDRDELALDLTFELQPLNEAIARLGAAVTNSERAVHRIDSSGTVAEIKAAWMRRNEAIREQLRLLEQRAAALIVAAERLIMAR